MVNGLQNFSQLQLKVDESVDLLQGLTFADGITLQKVEIVQDEVRTVIDNPNAYTPEYPGSINLILTVARPDGGTIEVEINGLNIKALVFYGIDITNSDPESLVPKVEVGDKDVYKHIEHLRIPEATRIIDMMWEYGAGSHSPEQYQELMMRLNTGMMREKPT